MKSICLLIALVCASSVTYCQTVDATQESIIGRVIETGVTEGITDKVLDRMGDAAAIAVTKLLGDKFLDQKSLTPFDVSNVLVVFHMAFAAPALVANPPDRQPRATVFVLQCLTQLTNDSAVRNSIAETRKFVLQQSNQAKTN